MKPKLRALVDLFGVMFMIGVNYYSQVNGINGNTVGELSAKYDNLFTPAGYAFAIWGIIFLLLFVYSLYQAYVVFLRKREVPAHKSIGYKLALVNLLNAIWVIVWLYEQTLLSVFTMASILALLIKIVIDTDMKRRQASLLISIFVQWPISVYIGWISVALVANVAAYLSKIGWDGVFMSEIGWTISMILVALCINLFMLISRNLREFALVGIWALYAIYIRHDGILEELSQVAFVSCIVLLLCVFIHTLVNRSNLQSRVPAS